MQYLVPLIILSFTYGRVACVLRQNNVIGDTRHTENIRAKKKAANMLALVVFTFIILWLPYNLYFLFLNNYLQTKLDTKTVLYLYINIYCLGMSSCLLNPVIYYFMNERFVDVTIVLMTELSLDSVWDSDTPSDGFPASTSREKSMNQFSPVLPGLLISLLVSPSTPPIKSPEINHLSHYKLQ